MQSFFNECTSTKISREIILSQTSLSIDPTVMKVKEDTSINGGTKSPDKAAALKDSQK